MQIRTAPIKGGWGAYADDLRIGVHGKTEKEARNKLEEAIKKRFELLREWEKEYGQKKDQTH
ncbi:MAG: hypothetical protein HPY81_09605 [Firmicutes bacterium]|nr:hypothetical protein [Bacillota bacterium]